jgi:hypothetical protein
MIAALIVMPSEEWDDEVIQEWADSHGYRIIKIEGGGFFDGVLATKLQVVASVVLVDDRGERRKCRAVVGHGLLGRARRQITIRWVGNR